LYDRLLQKANQVQSHRAAYFRDWQEVLVAARDGVFACDIHLTQSVGYSPFCTDGEHRSSISQRLGDSSNPASLPEWDYDRTATEVANAAGTMFYAVLVT
jgi:TldD protein